MAHLTRQEPIGMPHHAPDLDFEIQRQMTAFGVLPTDLDLFVEGAVSEPWGTRSITVMSPTTGQTSGHIKETLAKV